MENMINKINQSEKRNLCNNNLERMINAKQKELEKYKKMKKSVYEDWKLGEITREEYVEYKNIYDRDIQNAEKNLEYLESEKEKYREQILGDNTWIESLKCKKNISEISRDVVIELIDCIYVHEGGDITIKFKFADEYERMLEYIKMNEQLTAPKLRAI